MLRLERSQESHLLRVSGRIDAESLAELKMQMQIHPSPIALELGEVTLVDADAVRFLAAAEAAGTELRTLCSHGGSWYPTLLAENAKKDGAPKV